MSWITTCGSQTLRGPTLAIALAFGLAACGDATDPAPASFNSVEPVTLDGAPQFADGPIRSACSTHNRRVASNARCGCIQAAANLTLSQKEQKQAAAFFEEPERLQDMKLSDTPANERFWYAWARFAETAEDLCRRA